MTDQEAGRGRRWMWRLAGWAGFLVCVALALALLHARVCAYTSFKDGTSGDYARYTNAIWNTLHGRPFLYYLNETYLQVHLSYSLALLSPLFLIFDHPFMLAFVQWALIVGGAVILWSLCRRLKTPGYFTLGLLVFWLLHPFAQSVTLCEFHGVSTYFVTIPWLYCCLLFRRNWTWLPLVLILGLREDAGLVVIPLLLYFAVKERWRAGYVYAGVALAYVALACLVLYPAVNGISLLARRAAEIPLPGDEDDLQNQALNWLRLRSLATIVMIMLPFLYRGWKPLLVIPIAAIVITLASSYHSQVVLRIHYPAVILALLAVAMLEAWRTTAARDGWFDRFLQVVYAGYLVVWTLWSHYDTGLMWGSRQGMTEARFRVYRQIDAHGVHALWVARHQVPSTGVLWAEKRLGGFVANRAELAFSEPLLADPLYPDLMAFCTRASLPDAVRNGLVSHTWGVHYSDDNYLVLRRGADARGNAALLESLRIPTIRFSTSALQRGRNVFLPEVGAVRYWWGQRTKWPAVVSYAKALRLPAGGHTARFTLKVEPGADSGAEPRDTGSLALFVKGTEDKLAETQITLDRSGIFKEQLLSFTLKAGTDVEPRVHGGGARLWLLKVEFE